MLLVSLLLDVEDFKLVLDKLETTRLNYNLDALMISVQPKIRATYASNCLNTVHSAN